MEVHHHSHTSRKKWTHYFWEFLMLFLAVFCGFLAENQREHYVERLRAKEYAKTMIEDLTADTIELLDVIREDRILLSCFDSISLIIRNGVEGNTVPGSFYYYSSIGTWSPRVAWNNTTLTQMTQSGNLRYFQNSELTKKISFYSASIDFITVLNMGDVSYRDESIKLRNRLLNNGYFSRYSGFSIGKWMEIPDSLMKVRLPLQITDPVLLNEFANSFETRRRVLNLVISRDYKDALKTAKELIEILKKEYHLK